MYLSNITEPRTVSSFQRICLHLCLVYCTSLVLNILCETGNEMENVSGRNAK